VPANATRRRQARALWVAWIGLVSLTLGSFWLADAHTPGAATAAWVLAFAAAKGHVIAGVFMDMQRGPVVAAAAMSCFLLAEAALLFAILP